ncbi:hypothetical protein [Candidatus Paracaedibacter symbiosus]|uniref:hypothetical protein n=1 Tax=Candidatus Paracaedibacter symbiosus TaxID=244582 RepID=UPI000509C4F3|nr:hypothetical protein [Candidatus Paracaedibacter symbiosus]
MSKQEKRDNSKIVVILLILFVVGIVTYPGMVLIGFIIFIPTLSALLSDNSPNYSLSFCVGICNLAVSLPCFYTLLSNRFSLISVYQLIHDPFMLLLVLGGTGVGWLIHLGVPMLTVSYYRNHDQSNLQKLLEKHAKLKENWGDVIPNSESIDTLSKSPEELEQQSQPQTQSIQQ